ncbi:hypothetical protein [Sinorhizobium meliloti]|uniref:hypothetical protein n=1 Tax=Rhizobium meliloti TaxID=382 RepID=UPI001F4042A3
MSLNVSPEDVELWRMQVARLTEKQRDANRLLAGPAPNIMLRAGLGPNDVRSLPRDAPASDKCSGSRHVIVGFRFNHAKTSVWSHTPPKVLPLCFPSVRVRFDKTDFYVEL